MFYVYELLVFIIFIYFQAISMLWGDLMEKILPLAAMERIMKKAAPEIRVSDPAKDALREYLEEKGLELSKVAAEFAAHAGRKTIKAEDIRLAAKKH
jgi:histone H3/H4